MLTHLARELKHLYAIVVESALLGEIIKQGPFGRK